MTRSDQVLRRVHRAYEGAHLRAALRALASDGIQRGHMGLHARSIAVAAGANGDNVERVAGRIIELGDITLDAARRVLGELRSADASAVAVAE